MLECQQLTKRFGERLALDALDLRVGVGEIFCLLGANGAGKTTTINLMLGFHAPISGTVRVCGVDPAADPHVACALLAYIPEQVNFYPLLTGLEKLEYFVQISNAVLRRNSMSGSKVSVALVRLAFCADCRATRNTDSLASSGFSALVAVEVAGSAAGSSTGTARTDPTDGA